MSGLSSELEVLTHLGKGSFGEVYYRAKHVTTGGTVLVKTKPTKNNDPIAACSSEVTILSNCHSPFIVGLVGSFVVAKPPSPSVLCTVLEYCDGGSMSHVLNQVSGESGTLLPEECIRAVVASVALALEYLHNVENVCHRDVRGKNILLTADGHVKLSGFQQAVEMNESFDVEFVGSSYWMAPEVIRRCRYNGHADVWSLGITILELAQGAPPHSNLHPLRAISVIPTKASPTLSDPDEWSPEMQDFVRGCCQKDPSQRPDNVSMTRHPFILQEVLALKEMHSLSKSQHEQSPKSVADTSYDNVTKSGLPSLVWLLAKTKKTTV